MINTKIISEALNQIAEGAAWSLDEPFEYENLNWLDTEIKKPTKETVMQKYAELLEQERNTQYQRDRAKEYPSIQEQLDMQYWDSVNGTTVWQDTINAIKAKYPKVG